MLKNQIEKKEKEDPLLIFENYEIITCFSKYILNGSKKLVNLSRLNVLQVNEAN